MSSLLALSAEDRAVLSSAGSLIAAVRDQANMAYADYDLAPSSYLTIDIIAREMGAALVEINLPAVIQEMGIPALFGPPLLAINKSAPAGLRPLAIRHGLAHLVAGELEAEPGGEIRFMSTAFDPMTLEERRADLFALADIIPERELDRLRALEYSADELFHWVWCEILRYVAGSWDTERVRDRTRLRLAFRTP